MFPPDARPFEEPWQAQAFALAVSLNERGLFTWGEWANAFGAELAAGPQESGTEPYWRAWLATVEKLVVAKGAAREGELENLAAAWLRAAEATPHGQPIVLGAERRAM